MKIKILLVLAALAAITAIFLEHHSRAAGAAPAEKTSAAEARALPQKIKSEPKTETVTSRTAAQPNVCSTITAKTVIVSLSQQHMWACAGQASVYDAPVTTGATAYGDGTPTGTWAVYSKQTDRHLTGSDERGSWDDFVNYWMPFNGDYGFHDASWQTFAFGDLNQYQTGGSHGCVHLPLAAMKWLFNWSSIGTTVTIEA